MRNVEWFVLALCAVFLTRPSQASSGEPGCSTIIADTMVDCARLVAAEKRLTEISATDEERARNAVEIAELSGEVTALRSSPMVGLAGICKSLTPTTPRTCDALASRLSIDPQDPSLLEVAGATQAETLPRDQEIAKEAAAADRQTSTNKAGSSAQLDPVESIQPITLAGGAFTLAGTRSGTKGVGTITVNPLAILSPADDAVSGRLLDLSVSAPFDLDRGTGENGRYVSVRLRANLTAPISAAPLQERLETWLKAAGRYADSVEKVLQNAADQRGCAEAIARTRTVSKVACAQDVDSTDLREAREAAFAAMEPARRQAEKYYFGIDARLDSGDPTASDLEGDKGTHLLGGLAFGARIAVGNRWDWELRGRGAADYFQSRDDAAGDDPEAVYSFDWGGALILSGLLNNRSKQRMAFGVGLEGRHARDSVEAELAPTNYVNLNLMALVPTTDGSDFGLAIGIPLKEDGFHRGTIVSFSTDLGLLDHPAD
jgi:hypothetical protein